MKRAFHILCCLLLTLNAAAMAEGRYNAVFGTAQDCGRLTARFLYMRSPSGHKSGDATVLTSPDGKVMLLDAGDTDCADQVIASLHGMGITRIDYLVASHPHDDHVGGFDKIMQSFDIGAVYTSHVELPSAPVKAYMQHIKT